jgi:hypothetical protein
VGQSLSHIRSRRRCRRCPGPVGSCSQAPLVRSAQRQPPLPRCSLRRTPQKTKARLAPAVGEPMWSGVWEPQSSLAVRSWSGVWEPRSSLVVRSWSGDLWSWAPALSSSSAQPLSTWWSPRRLWKGRCCHRQLGETLQSAPPERCRSSALSGARRRSPADPRRPVSSASASLASVPVLFGFGPPTEAGPPSSIGVSRGCL